MPATRVWQDADGNWGNTANWSGGAVPVSGDTVQFLTGSKAISTGLDQHAVQLAKFVMASTCKVSMGTGTGAPLEIGADRFYWMGGADTTSYLKARTGSATFTRAIINGVGSNGVGTLSLDGAITDLAINQGNVQLFAGTTARAALDAINNASSRATLQINTATVTALLQRCGNSSMIGLGTITDAYIDAFLMTITTGTLTNLHQRGGTTIFNSSTAAITLAEMFGGKLDLTGDLVAKTITTLRAYNAAVIDARNGLNNIVITNQSLFNGATLYTDQN